ncbi:hypothetical protein KUTeg_020761 [Tegillarca granosa]|uniref:Major facilitator superfamily (MFS) profile domain-containing protein n=1 Tax=Tegillarca granosa TaxID=220873 RepID=A0ABQ9E8V8_TEGGR|nr:hypothetical protein KUTeg_020761 [Tegillarca granosa]
MVHKIFIEIDDVFNSDKYTVYLIQLFPNQSHVMYIFDLIKSEIDTVLKSKCENMADNIHDSRNLQNAECSEVSTTNTVHTSMKLTVEYTKTNTEDNVRCSNELQSTAEYNETKPVNKIRGLTKEYGTADDIRDSRDLTEDYDETTQLLNNRRSSTTKYRSLYVIFLSIFATLGSFLFGYHIAIVSSSILFITDTYLISTFWHSVIVSATIASAVIFSIFAGILSDLFGRKPVLLFSAFVYSCGAVIMSVADGIYMLLAGRLFVGMGRFPPCAYQYIAEISPPNTRGFLATFNQLFITIGILVSSIIAGAFSSVTNGWRYMLGLPVIISLIYFFGIFFLPESPRYLVAKNQIERARTVLTRLRGTSQIDDELRDINKFSSLLPSIYVDLNIGRISTFDITYCFLKHLKKSRSLKQIKKGRIVTTAEVYYGWQDFPQKAPPGCHVFPMGLMFLVQ